MYRTIINNINGNTCTDENGSKLTRIGNMAINPGDVVWTDGVCIYGNGEDREEELILFPEQKRSSPGIPINSTGLGELLIYHDDYTIESIGYPFWSVKFVNNDKLYRTWGIPLSDMEVMDDGTKVGIYTPYNAYYYYNQKLKFFRPATDSDEIYTYNSFDRFCSSMAYSTNDNVSAICYTEETITYTSEAHPERNEHRHGDDKPSLSIKYYNYQYETLYETETNNKAYFYRDNSETVIDLEQFANLSANVVYGKMSEHGTSDHLSPVLISKTCDVIDSRVDKYGNYYLIVETSAEGYCFQDYSQTCYILGVHIVDVTEDTDVGSMVVGGVTYKWDTKRTQTYDRTMAFEGSRTKTTTFGIRVTDKRKLLIKNGSLEKVIEQETKIFSSKNGQTYSPVGIRDDTGWNADLIMHRVWVGYGGISTLGVFLGDYTVDEITHFQYPQKTYIPLLNNYTESINRQDYQIPIQDGFYIKNSDYTKVYKGSSLILETNNFNVTGITKINKKDNSYLLLDKDLLKIGLWRDGTLTYPRWAGSSSAQPYIDSTNKRLRHIDNINVLDH